jgi:hypothetical protein
VLVVIAAGFGEGESEGALDRLGVATRTQDELIAVWLIAMAICLVTGSLLGGDEDDSRG